MKESFALPLLLALLFVGVTLGISSVSISERRQTAQVGGANVSAVQGSVPVTFSVGVSETLTCGADGAKRTVGFFTDPVSGGYFSIYGVGGTDLGDREPGLYDFVPGTYTWEAKARTGYVRGGDTVGSFIVPGGCDAPSSGPGGGAVSGGEKPVTVSVSVGGACVPEKNMTQVAIATEPRGGAEVALSKENGNLITSLAQGVTYLPNGNYTWKAVPKEGYSIAGEHSGALTLTACPSIIAPSVSVGNACDPIEEGVPVTFGLRGEGKAYFALVDTITKQEQILEGGTEYVPNGSYVWTAIPAKGESIIFDGRTSGGFTVSACKSVPTTSYVPPRAGTLLFFREGKLIDPVVRQGERIAVRVDLSGASSVELERISTGTREVLGMMTKDGTTSRWLYAWDVGTPLPGDYDLIARATGKKGESVAGSRIVSILPSKGDVATPFTSGPEGTEWRSENAEESPISVPKTPVFRRLGDAGADEDILSALPVRGVADLITTEDIIAAEDTLPDSLRSPDDLRVFCSSEENDDVCFKLLPEVLRDEARTLVDEARDEIARSFKERPHDGIDTDKDGLTDFDESHFYGTDPQKVDSDGDGHADGEELLAHQDPIRKTPDRSPVRFEDPTVGGYVRAGSLSVAGIERRHDVASGTVITTAEAPLVLIGKGLPGAIVTVYVFSDPVVSRVKVDENGLWSHVLTEPLEDGEHEAYVAMTDSEGRILAKSVPLVFTKHADAISMPVFDFFGLTDRISGVSGSAPRVTISLIAVILIGVSGWMLHREWKARKEKNRA